MPMARVSPGPTPTTAPARTSSLVKHEVLHEVVENDPISCHVTGDPHQRNAWHERHPRPDADSKQCCLRSPADDSPRVSLKTSDRRSNSDSDDKTTSGDRKKNHRKATHGRSKRGISGLLDITCHTLTPYQKLVKSLEHDESWQRDVTLERRIGFYRFKGDAGTGNFSRVKIGIHCLTKERVAIKIMEKAKLDAKTQRMLSREISSMDKLHHPNLVRLFEVIETFSKVYLVMEYAAAGELYQRITSCGRMREETAKPLFAQIVSAIDHMHEHRIIHRDIKAENVFFSDAETVKVGDFGFSTHVKTQDELLNTFCGSPPYAAPELFSDESYVGPSVDIWALGVLLYFMVTATMPFRAQTVASLKHLILNGEYLMPEFVSSDCSRVIRGLLQHEPTRRLAIRDIRKCHWLQGQIFASCLPKYELVDVSCQDTRIESSTRSTAVSLLSDEEKEVRRQLLYLGIDEDLLHLNHKDGVRSNVIGTYRILMHRVLCYHRQFGSRVAGGSGNQEPEVGRQESGEECGKRPGSGVIVAAENNNRRSSKSRSKKNSLLTEKRIFVDSEGFFIPQATELFTHSESEKRKRSEKEKFSTNNRTDSNGNTFSGVERMANKKHWRSKKFVKSCVLF